VLYQLSYTPVRTETLPSDPGRFKHNAGADCKGEASDGILKTCLGLPIRPEATR
jgi:hypothetical protein